MTEPVFTRRVAADATRPATLALALTADERRRARFRRESTCGTTVSVALDRGLVLRPGDVLADAADTLRLRIEAAPERVLHVTAPTPHGLLVAAYHLGNRHVALEVGPDYLRLLPDPVLADMLRHLGASCEERVGPFEPEGGAYGGHAHAHAHGH